MLELLRADHGPALLAFELENRAYFVKSISDRGDAYFEEFDERLADLLAADDGAYYVQVDEDGSVLGRFNLYFAGGGVANLGYRVAESAAGRGVATNSVREMCEVAAQRGLKTLRAATSLDNVASQKVLKKNGFVEVGPADPAEIGGQQGTWYEFDLTKN